MCRRQRLSRRARAEADGFQLVADLGPSNGVPAVAEAKGVAAQAGSRPGGARRVAADNPSARAIEVQPQDSLYDISRRYAVNLRALIETNGLEPPYMLNAGDTVFLPPPNVHVVQSGETLYSVSRRYNVDTRSLALLNGIGRPWTVWPGDELLLPPLARDQARDPVAAPVVVAPVVVPVAAAVPPPPAPSLKPAQPAKQLRHSRKPSRRTPLARSVLPGQGQPPFRKRRPGLRRHLRLRRLFPLPNLRRRR